MATDLVDLSGASWDQENLEGPITLYEKAGHGIYWLGIPVDTAFRCNTYLIRSGADAILVDPGNRQDFEVVRSQVAQLLPPEKISGLVLSHQDPDVAASITEWVKLNPAIRLFSTPRSHLLLQHYGYGRFGGIPVDVEQESCFQLSSGSELRFISAPFLHFPGAITTLDITTGYLFSGDVWAALDTEWKLLVSSFSEHRAKLDLFHKDYMASNVAARGFAGSLSRYEIRGILPQHGSIIGPGHVEDAIHYLETLECGTDLIYAGLSRHAGITPAGDVALAGQSEVTVIGEVIESHGDDSADATYSVREALAQAERIARLRDKALEDLRQTQLVLQRNRTQLSEAQRIAHLGHWDWQISGDTLEWSDEIYRIFGLEVQEFGADYEAFLARVHPEDRQAVIDAVDRALQGREEYAIDHRIVLPDGEIRMVHERAEVTHDDSGVPVRMIGTVQDITDRKRMEEALRKSEERFRRLLEAAGQGIIGIDAEGRATFANPAALRMLGYEEPELIGQGTHALIHHSYPNGESYPVEECRMLAPFRDGRMRRVSDEVLWRSDGSSFPTEYVTAPILSNDRVEAIAVIFDDISDRHRMLQELEYQASHDYLTRLLNRNKLREQLLKEQERSDRYGDPVAVIMYDIDKFKAINDNFGHDRGDSVLQEITAVVGEQLRTLDHHGRWGGEEFIIVLPGTQISGAAYLAERCRQAVAGHSLEDVGGVTISCGVVQYESGESAESLLKRADECLYRAKGAGRNRVVHA